MGVPRFGRGGQRLAGLLVAVFVMSGITACGDEGSGSDLYAMACAGCHGADRQGVEHVGPDLTETSFALEESDEWITGRIHDGFKGMPRFERTLSESQIAVIVSYLRLGDEGPPLVVAPPTTVPPPTAPPTTPVTVTTIDPTSPPGSATTTVVPVPATTSTDPPAVTAPPDTGDDVLALGQLIYDVEAGGVGCARCHGFDAGGTSNGPNIVGASKSAISGALGGGVPDMDEITLSRDELDAVYQYLVLLTLER
jgi:mono/diheme cytochrome c family protein